MNSVQVIHPTSFYCADSEEDSSSDITNNVMCIQLDHVKNTAPTVTTTPVVNSEPVQKST